MGEHSANGAHIGEKVARMAREHSRVTLSGNYRIAGNIRANIPKLSRASDEDSINEFVE